MSPFNAMTNATARLDDDGEPQPEPLMSYLLDRPALLLTVLDIAERVAHDRKTN